MCGSGRDGDVGLGGAAVHERVAALSFHSGATAPLFSAWVAAAHAFAAALHARPPARSGRARAPLVLWTVAMSNLLPGLFGALPFLRGDWYLAGEILLPSLIPALLAAPAVQFVAWADGSGTFEAEALGVLAIGLLLPWAGSARTGCALGVVVGLTLSAAAIGVAALTAERAKPRWLPKITSAAGDSYRQQPTLHLVLVPAPAARPARSSTTTAAALLVTVGAGQIAAIELLR